MKIAAGNNQWRNNGNGINNGSNENEYQWRVKI
jgi:hypothetical protein